MWPASYSCANQRWGCMDMGIWRPKEELVL